MIKFQKPADQVLLSDYLKWHAPLNRSYLAGYEDSEEEADREYEEFETLLTGEGLLILGTSSRRQKLSSASEGLGCRSSILGSSFRC
ncbi:hypothetical protein HGG76_27655 [Ochrobactrum tritici]|uniref:Uncharacterized protein n=1 Tax=Brucella tritici TaxID=94626 RepID=A0A7X6FT02_9HYPH|nr:hypothetical protein [Brucella tritici]NKW11374.1 hypothetical protein [Brucella tritici]